MMSDKTHAVRDVDGLVRVSDDDGKLLATFAGSDLPAWRRFQLDVLKDFNIVVTDVDMPVVISRTIQGPNRRNDAYVPSG
jgi:hypothetical protein